MNQILNEARTNNNLIDAQIQIRKEEFAPGGYAVTFKIFSKNLGKTFTFYDSLAAKYPQITY